MARVSVVDSPLALGFGERGFVQTKKGLKKYSRDKTGRVWYGWRKGTSFASMTGSDFRPRK